PRPGPPPAGRPVPVRLRAADGRYSRGVWPRFYQTRPAGPVPASARIRQRSLAVARERILFVCTANVDRSRTAEDLYRDDPRYEVRSAGTAPFATTPLTRELLQWADRVFVMCERHDRHHTQIKLRFPDVDRPVIDLDV